MVRRNSRIRALIFLYNYDLTGERIDENYLDQLFKEADALFDKQFYEELVNGVLDHYQEINRTINLSIRNWTLDRMSVVDRNLIRIGTYEMLYTTTPKPIIIDEILDLTHEYSETTSLEESRFNNRLLEQIGRSIDGK
ncbi:MAG TPA: transcription antitermination factor NusB [Acholeplasmataceae bacterium]|jgi:N utilization substance protein B|nr:transcription antitermination factor NusB [Acholeplasmataceae bacterium]